MPITTDISESISQSPNVLSVDRPTSTPPPLEYGKSVRKEKSLGLLSENFLRMYEGAAGSEISLDIMAAELGEPCTEDGAASFALRKGARETRGRGRGKDEGGTLGCERRKNRMRKRGKDGI